MDVINMVVCMLDRDVKPKQKWPLETGSDATRIWLDTIWIYCIFGEAV